VNLYKKGSLIPLGSFEGEGIVTKSSRGRVVFPPVRYWLGKLVALFLLFLCNYTMCKMKLPATDFTVFIQTYMEIYHTATTSRSYPIGLVVFGEIVG
jgi:hypothetical protein